MANGPPTPPPTTETEIQDEARTNQPPPAVAHATEPATVTVPVPQPVPQDSYERKFPNIVGLASQGNWKELIQFAELSELVVQSAFI